jgi:hypothetical protein
MLTADVMDGFGSVDGRRSFFVDARRRTAVLSMSASRRLNSLSSLLPRTSLECESNSPDDDGQWKACMLVADSFFSRRALLLQRHEERLESEQADRRCLTVSFGDN